MSQEASGFRYIYLEVPWLDGTDADYFKFESLTTCIDYMKAEGIWLGDYTISTNRINSMEIPEDDYTYIQD
jgi:hypothetical protein